MFNAPCRIDHVLRLARTAGYVTFPAIVAVCYELQSLHGRRRFFVFFGVNLILGPFVRNPFFRVLTRIERMFGFLLYETIGGGGNVSFNSG